MSQIEFSHTAAASVEQVTKPDDAAVLGAMSMMLQSVPQVVDRVDAFAVYPGLGETWRVEQAVQHYEDNPQARHLFVAGVNPNENTFRRLDVEGLRQPPFNLSAHRENGVVSQGKTPNTPGQASWMAEQVENYDIKSFGLVVSPYHILRALGTTLATFDKRGLPQVPIIPVPVVMSPRTIIPETGKTATEMFNGEAARIKAYQEKGDVASLARFEEYFDWLHDQPIIKDR